MGNKPSNAPKNQNLPAFVNHTAAPKISNPISIPSFPLSSGAASLSCLAAEHYQIHDQETLDAWRTKALHTIDDLYEQKGAFLRHEAHISALLGQLRAIIDEDLPHHGSGYFIDDQHVRSIHTPTSDF